MLLKTVLILVSITAFFTSGGCAQSPTQQYRTAVNAYNGTMRVATIAVDQDRLNQQQIDAIDQLRPIVRARLSEARERLRIDPKDPGVSDIASQAQSIVRAIRMILEERPQPTGSTDLPVPGI